MTDQTHVSPVSGQTILAALPAALHTFCLLRGLSREHLHAQCGVPVDGYRDFNEFVPYEHVIVLWDALQAAFPDEPMGVAYGEFLGHLDTGVVKLSAACASNLGEALNAFIRLQHLLDPSVRVVWERDGDTAIVTASADPRLMARRDPIEAMLVSAHRTAERLATRPIAARMVEMPHVPTAETSQYQRIFQADVRQTHRYAIAYDAQVLELPVVHGLGDLSACMMDHTEVAFESATMSAKQRVLSWVADQFREPRSDINVMNEQATMSRAAAALGISESALQQQLASEQTSFAHVLESALRRRAELLLANSHLEVFEIGLLLGFLEQKQFESAFKRWTGQSPAAHRKLASRQFVGGDDLAHWDA